MSLYRDMDQVVLDAGYNNSMAVANSTALLADFDARSAHVRSEPGAHLDLHYGPAPRNRIDYFGAAPPPDAPAPVLVFIHGGYWQMRAKETFSFLARGPRAHGIHVAFPGYTLAPESSLTGIVAEIRAALDWLAANAGRFGGDAQQMYLAGWSAGGHLTAQALDHPAVKGGLAISGIFDLEPIRLSYLNAKLGLDPDEAQHLSPLLHLPATSPPLMVACGTAELPELQRQSREFATARAHAGLPGRLVALDGLNHFTILEELARPDGALTGLLRELVAG
jgi:acetyl esterase/lipase